MEKKAEIFAGEEVKEKYVCSVLGHLALNPSAKSEWKTNSTLPIVVLLVLKYFSTDRLIHFSITSIIVTSAEN